MANIHQALLDSPNRRLPISFKALAITASLTAALVATVSLVALNVNPTTINPFKVFVSSHICDQTFDPSSCSASISDASFCGIIQPTPVRLLRRVLSESHHHVRDAISVAELAGDLTSNVKQQAALADCKELLHQSEDRLLKSQASINTQSHADVHTWLSTVLTNYVTCLDELEGDVRSAMEESMHECMALASTSLAVLNTIATLDSVTEVTEFPSWVSARDRKLLETTPRDWQLGEKTASNAVKANVVVATDGSGDYKTVTAAVASVPDNGNSRYVIYVKAGTYSENVQVGTTKKNVMIVGDGMDSTIITGSLNVVDGSTTFNSATLAAVGDGFIAQDICIQNRAGAIKQQAVALRVGADQSVINRCKIDAYQDTLYTHSNRQFYRDCYITGTVDFIFGNSAVVFQNCQIVARKPLSYQQNTITAQGRTDPNQNTGISIQNCQISPSSDLKPVMSTIPSYLGRPWKEYSRTVFMESSIDSHINSAGWLAWSGDFALKTLYYGEYSNSGPGAGTSNRVTWPGYHVITDASVAQQFTVGVFIQGGSWLQSTGAAYTLGL